MPPLLTASAPQSHFQPEKCSSEGRLTCSCSGVGALGSVLWGRGLALPQKDDIHTVVVWLGQWEQGRDCWNIPSPATIDLDLTPKPLRVKWVQRSMRGLRAHLDYAERGGIRYHGL